MATPCSASTSAISRPTSTFMSVAAIQQIAAKATTSMPVKSGRTSTGGLICHPMT
jgi:hypothetical protein